MTDALRETLQAALGTGFRVERELGGGGMSRVFVARDVSLDRDVVVKVLARESTAGISGDRFRREIQVIARLQHPHIVPILSAGEADGSLYYVMPFIGGETLRARLSREGPMPVLEVTRLLREILDALAFAHAQGVIHRDVKPENVLIEAGHAIVADFGIAKALRESGTMTAAGVAMGTPAYMSPEQATADPTADHRADLYSVGVLAYELLAGTPPFSGSTQQVITAHLATPPEPLRNRRADVPEGLATLIARSLEKEPSKRPQTSAEMIAALDAVVTPTVSIPAADASAKRRSAVIPAIAAAVLVVALGAFAWWRTRDARPQVVAGADLIAIMPLGAVSDTSLARLGEDLVVTLSTNLDGVGSLRTIDAVTLLMKARKLATPIQLADAQQLASELGARSVLTGTLIHEGAAVRATVTLQPVDGSEAIGRASAVAPAGDIAALTDSLTWELLRQVWRRGAPPSPVLTGLATPSMPALRAFLDGERAFQRIDVETALAAYRRAFELDTNFVQAYLRFDYVNTWMLNPVNVPVRARLQALQDRLPDREKMWLETTRAPLTVPEKVARWKEAVRAYPDYPPMLMSAADEIIHFGPMYGISLSEAGPLLDRLDQLVPDHADTKFHIAAVTMRSGSDEERLRWAEQASVSDFPGLGAFNRWHADVVLAQSRGQPMPPVERAFSVARELARLGSSDAWGYFTGFVGIPDIDYAVRLDVLDSLRKAGIYSGDIARASTLGEGTMRVGRGDWTGGLRALRTSESAMLPPTARLTSARLAALGAWSDAIDPSVADSVLQRVSQLARSLPITDLDRIELAWSDGLVGVKTGDSARVFSHIAALRGDTVGRAHIAARSLHALWRSRTDVESGTDSLRAISDADMRDGQSLLTFEVVHRFVVARALRRRGQPAEAERYLMWTEALVNRPREVTVQVAMGPLVAYERGVALEEAGLRDAAAFQFKRFIQAMDMPPEAHRGYVDDAKARLARISGDVPPVKTLKK